MENASLETMEYSIPFTQILDCEGISEEDRSDVRLSVVGTDVQIKNDYSGGKVFFDAQVRLCADITAYQKRQTCLLYTSSLRAHRVSLRNKFQNARFHFIPVFLRDDAAVKMIPIPALHSCEPLSPYQAQNECRRQNNCTGGKLNGKQKRRLSSFLPLPDLSSARHTPHLTVRFIPFCFLILSFIVFHLFPSILW